MVMQYKDAIERFPSLVGMRVGTIKIVIVPICFGGDVFKIARKAKNHFVVEKQGA